jgi:hypothetical protein
MSVLLTPEIVSQIAKILGDHHAAVAAAIYGPESVTGQAWGLAVALGLVDPSEPSTINRDLHRFGAFMAHLDHASQFKRYGKNAADFLAEIERNPVPYTVTEERAAHASAVRGASYIVGLGNKIGATVGSRLIEADKALDNQLRDTIRDTVSSHFGDEDATDRMRQRATAAGKPEDFYDHAYRSTIKRMVSDLGHSTGDWARDFTRIAQTESQRSFEEGQVQSWRSQEEERAKRDRVPVERVLAYKIPRPDACKHCLRLHRDAGGDLRIFDLSDLEANGVNVGRKADAWEPVVGPVHPFCACQLVRLPRFVSLPAGWRSGQAVPDVVGQDGSLYPD